MLTMMMAIVRSVTVELASFSGSPVTMVVPSPSGSGVAMTRYSPRPVRATCVDLAVYRDREQRGLGGGRNGLRVI